MYSAMTNKTTTNQVRTARTKAAAFEDIQVFGAEHLCGYEEGPTFLGTCAICGFFVALSALAIYVMVTFPQTGI
jgi:hypothetical protein